MADRYWVGGTGTWSSINTANWSATSGGVGGETVPTRNDNVFFDAGSDAGSVFTVQLQNAQTVNDFTASNLDFTMTFLASFANTLSLEGSLFLPATNFIWSYSGSNNLTFNGTTTGNTITTNGVVIPGPIVITGIFGEWTLGSALTCGSLTLTRGTFDTSVNNYAVTAGVFSSSNSNTRTINLNGSTISLSGGTTAWNMATSTNATLNAGTSTIVFSADNARLLSGAGLTYYNVVFSSTTPTTSVKIISGANIFNNLTFATIDSPGIYRIDIDADQIINGTFTVSGSDGNRRPAVRSNILGTPRTLTCAAIAAMTDVDFRDITIAGAHGTLSGTRLGDVAGNTNIIFDAGIDKYWNLVGGGNWNDNAWATSSGGTVANTNFPLAQDTVIIENTGLNTSATVTINVSYNIGNFDMSTRSDAMTLDLLAAPSLYGNVAFSPAVTCTGFSILNFLGRTIKTFDPAGQTFNNNVSIQAPGGGVQLINNNFVTSNIRTTTLVLGTLDLNDLDWTTGIFNSSNSNVRTIDFGTGSTIGCTGNGTTWNTATKTNLSVIGTGTIDLITLGTGLNSLKTFSGGSFNYSGITLNQGSTGTLTISGSNTFNNITNSVQPTTILFLARTTTTVNDFTLSGTPGNLVTISSVSALFTLSKASGTVSVSNLDIRNSNATGGATWNAFTSNNNVNGGNNTGWRFTDSTGNMLLLFF